MGKSILSVAGILVASLLLAIGWVDISMGSKSVDYGPLGLPVSYSCADGLAFRHGVDLAAMDRTQGAILDVKKHVQSVEMVVEENPGKQARYLVSIVMNSGSRVQTRMDALAWNRLDAALAGDIQRCVAEFMALGSKQPNQAKPIVLNI